MPIIPDIEPIQRTRREAVDRFFNALSPEDKVDFLKEQSREADKRGDLESAIGFLGGAATIEAAQKAQASVTLEDWGTFYKLPSGGWHGPGGKYGSSTELGKKLDAALGA